MLFTWKTIDHFVLSIQIIFESNKSFWKTILNFEHTQKKLVCLFPSNKLWVDGEDFFFFLDKGLVRFVFNKELSSC